MIKPPPQQKWRLSIILAFSLLVRSHFCSTDANTTEFDNNNQQQSTSAPAGGATTDEKYEVIDVAANQNGNAQTGQTMRFFTTGEVNDDFWLKHLGEDFRHAIHLQVGSGSTSNDHYDDVYNTTMTEDGSTYEIHQRYAPKTNANPVKANKDNEKNDEQKTNEDYKNPTEKDFTEVEGDQKNNNSSSTSKNPHPQEEVLHEPQRNDQINKEQQPNTKNETVVQTQKHEVPYERVFTIDDDSGHNLATKFYNPNSFNIPTNDKLSQAKSKYHKYTNTNTPHKDTKHTHQKTSKDGDDSNGGSSSKSLSPLVVTLPENQQTIHQMDMHEKPVVVKMPPMIYHSNPQTYTQTDNTNTEQTKQQQQQQQHNTPHYTQYQQQHKQFSQNFYNPPPFQESGASSAFTAQGVYRSLDRSNASSDHAKQSLRYLLRRPQPHAHPPPPFSSSSRVSRSNHDFYYRGL